MGVKEQTLGTDIYYIEKTPEKTVWSFMLRRLQHREDHVQMDFVALEQLENQILILDLHYMFLSCFILTIHQQITNIILEPGVDKYLHDIRG